MLDGFTVTTFPFLDGLWVKIGFKLVHSFGSKIDHFTVDLIGIFTVNGVYMDIAN